MSSILLFLKKKRDSQTDITQQAAASKEPEQGKMSQKQAGLSNTDTKHSTDPVTDGKSVKSEGAPETAKLQGTVDPSRPAK